MAKRVAKKVAKKAAPKKRVKRADAGSPSPEFMQMLTGALSQESGVAGRAAALDKAREIHAYSGMPATIEQVIQSAETLRVYIEDGVVPGQASAADREGAVENPDNSADEPYVLTPAERAVVVDEMGDTGGVRLGQ